MNLGLEFTLKPGENSLFVVQAKVERSTTIYYRKQVWWGLWVGWWLFPWRKRREWLWTWEKHDEDESWYTLTVMLLGFEVTWQWRRKG